MDLAVYQLIGVHGDGSAPDWKENIFAVGQTSVSRHNGDQLTAPFKPLNTMVL